MSEYLPSTMSWMMAWSGRFAEIVAIDAAAHMTERIERSGMGDGDAIAIRQPEPRPGGFGQRRFVMRDQIAGRLIERGDDLMLPVAQQDPRVRAESFGSADVAVLVHEDDGFVLRVEAESPRANAVLRHSPVRDR